MMWYYGSGGAGWMLVTMVGMLLFWGGVVALVVWLVRRPSGPQRTEDAALDILRRRLAAGEISPEDFETTKKALGA
ncbi:MAG TPA: SHOCT domain-containing protein [Candidatus Dormibacteraeota bacterium]|nr:SHOCT domain-containing protein [Candidatus Dormibacteraeota bacterium]